MEMTLSSRSTSYSQKWDICAVSNIVSSADPAIAYCIQLGSNFHKFIEIAELSQSPAAEAALSQDSGLFNRLWTMAFKIRRTIDRLSTGQLTAMVRSTRMNL
jgi:hypothetical protein